MNEYLLLFMGGDMELSPNETQSHMQMWMEWIGNLGKRGIYVTAQPLSKNGKRISGSNKMITDVPIMEGKEMVNGYLVCRASSLYEAVEISKGCPILELESGIVEVREIQELKM